MPVLENGARCELNRRLTQMNVASTQGGECSSAFRRWVSMLDRTLWQ
ncbi:MULTISPECIES: hypothetical protein [unclassified Microcoleus]